MDTPIVENIAKMVAAGQLQAELIRVESEHSAMAACIGAQAAGVRSYTATSSQGLALMHELLFVASGMRLPIVMGVVNRALSAPLNIWGDQSDSLAARDCGWVQIYVESAQEAFDSHLQAYKIAENVNLPVMVCLDGYVVSHTYEPVQLIDEKALKRWLPRYIADVSLDPTKPVTMGAMATPEWYQGFKQQQARAMERASEMIKGINREFFSSFGRMYGNGLIETIGLEGRDTVIVTIGSVVGTMRAVQNELDVGLIRVRSVRPWPAKELAKKCEGLKHVIVLEKAISFGAGGPLYQDVKAAVYDLEPRPKIAGFVGGLGGRDIRPEDIKAMVEKVRDGFEGVGWV